MKALTLHQPWAWAVRLPDPYGKRIENRTWGPPASVIGQRIAIHAGRFCDWTEKATVNEILVELGAPRLAPDAFNLGSVIAIATLAGVVTESDSPWFSGPLGWVLEDVVPIVAVNARGRLGLWDLPPHVEKQVQSWERWRARWIATGGTA